MDHRVSIRRRDMESGALTCTDMERERQKERFQMLHASSDPEHERNHTFLKVSPNLFTPDKLPLFDSLDLYTSLIKCSKFMEQGERLHNLSWRIINKSLLKDQNINKSKKRDGVRNLYNVINPIKQTHSFPQLQHGSMRQQTLAKQPLHQHQQQQHCLPASSSASSRQSSKTPSSSITPTRSQISLSQKLVASKSISPEPMLRKFEAPSRSQTTTPDLRKELSRKKLVVSPELIHLQKPSNGLVSTIAASNLISAEPRPSLQSQTSLFSRNASSKSLFAKNQMTALDTGHSSNGVLANGPADMLQASHNGIVHNGEKPSIFAGDANSAHSRNVNGSASGQNNGQDHKNMFFSSEDEESDWDSMSDDSEIYDEEEDNDEYYENQWDKLMFFKTHNNSGSQPLGKESSEKKSLLSGLFSQEKKEKIHEKKPEVVLQPKPVAPIHSSSEPLAPETTDIVAVGSVTPSSSWQNKDNAVDEQKSIAAALQRSKKLGSFSSIVSEATKERYYHESNAPPAAQTILPTALSTHMFVPNNVHQQRMALRNNNFDGMQFETAKAAARRESIDIPSKNRNNSFIKTRMEISEEENFARAYARCVKK